MCCKIDNYNFLCITPNRYTVINRFLELSSVISSVKDEMTKPSRFYKQSIVCDNGMHHA
jgi:hypothetical protein